MIKCYLIFASDTLNVGSAFDGDNVYDFLSEGSVLDEAIYLELHQIPLIGVRILLRASYSLEVEITDVYHYATLPQISRDSSVEKHTVTLVCRLVEFDNWKY